MARPKLVAKTKLVDGVRTNIADGTVAKQSTIRQENTAKQKGLTEGKTITPTVISDNNVRDNIIPGIKAEAQQMLGGMTQQQQQDFANRDPEGFDNQADKEGWGTSSAPQNEYDSLYQSVMGTTPGNDNIYDAELNLLDQMQRTADASTRSYIDSLKSTYDARRAQQQAATGAQKAGAQTLLMSGGGYRSGSGSQVLSGIERAGIRELSTLDAEEQGLKAGALAAQTNNDYKVLGEKLGLMKEKRAEKLKTVSSMWEAQVAEKKETQKGINEVLRDAAQNGATKDALSAIAAAGSIPEAIAAGGQWLQTATGELGEYIFYRNQAIAVGQVPVGFESWQDANAAKENSRAYSRSYAAAKGAADAKGTTTTFKALTEGQGKDLTYAQRGDQALAALANYEEAIVGMSGLAYEAAKAAEGNNYTNQFTDPTVRAFRQAQRNFLTAVLRRESGAQIAPSEFETGELQYFPRPGDDAATLEQKRQNRETAIASFKMNVPDYEARVAASPTGALLMQGQASKAGVDEYIANNPDQAESITRLYESGFSDDEVYQYLQQGE